MLPACGKGWGTPVNHERARIVLAGEVQQLRSTLGAADSVEIAVECDDLASVLAAAEARLGDVIVVAADLPGFDRPTVSTLRGHGLGVIGVVAAGDTEASKRLRRMGVDARIFTDSSPEAVGRALRDVEAHVKPPRAPHDPLRASFGGAVPDNLSGVVWRQVSPSSLPLVYGVARRKLIAVWGPTGAPGRSTVAAGVAGAFARRGLETLLIDADVYGGSQAITLSLLDESPGLVAASRAADRGALNVPVLADLSVEVEPRLRVLTGIASADRWTEVRPASFENVLGLSRDLARVTVVDCGFCLEDDPELSYDTYAPRRNAVTLAALSAADEIVVVGRDDGIGLARLEAGLLELRSIGGSPAHVVLNQVRLPAPSEEEETAASRRPRTATTADVLVERRAQSWRRLRAEVSLHQLPYDERAVAASASSGLPPTSAAPGSRLAEALDNLARVLVPRRGFV